jgi:5-methylcytosine-specific restriction endonuclease McrA
MMRRVPILCLETGCSARVWEEGQSRCPDHRSSSGWARRPRVGRQAAGYGAEWERRRRRHLAAHPVSVDCGATTDLQVDHVLEFHGLGDPLRLDPANLATRCRRCHARKSGRAGGLELKRRAQQRRR